MDGTESDSSTTAGPTTNNMMTGDDTGTTGDDPTGGSTGGSTGPMGDVSHATDIQPLWDMYCVTACHTAGGSGATYFLLDAAVAYDSIVNKTSTMFPNLTYVTPGDPDASYLLHKIKGTQLEAGGGGSKMPLGMSLPESDIATIEAWIAGGALP